MSAKKLSKSESLREVQLGVDTPAIAPPLNPGEFRICDVRIHAVQVDNLLAIVQHWMESKRAFHYVSRRIVR